jgi:hypothetical protein
MDNAPTLPLDSQLCFSIYSASIAIHRVYKPMLDELGVTYTQYLVLSTLWEHDGLTISAIGDRLALEPSGWKAQAFSHAAAVLPMSVRLRCISAPKAPTFTPGQVVSRRRCCAAPASPYRR